MSGPAARRRPARRRPPAVGGGRRRPGWAAAPCAAWRMIGMPAEKPKDFRGSFRRLARRAPARARRSSSSSSCSPSSASTFASSGRRSWATRRTSSSTASSASSCPAGVTQAQADRRPARHGQAPASPTCSSGMTRDARRRHRLRRPARTILLVARRSSTSSARCSRWAAGLHHGRRHAADRLPAAPATSTRSSRACRCSYFDSHPRGDILSRVTNDIDNIARLAPAEPDPAHHVGAARSSACSS